MDNRFERTEFLFGENSMKKLNNSHIAIFGVGGVGGYVVEVLARSGIGHFTLIDNDKVSITNINRQIIATTSTLGQYKVDVVKNRILDINPDAEVNVLNMFYLPENADSIDLSKFDYVIDCIDTITAKIEIVVRCKNLNVPLISSMGSRERLNHAKIKVCDVFKTNYDKLAKVMRRELKKRKISHLKVVCSDEDTRYLSENKTSDKKYYQSSAIGPSLMGIIIGGEVLKDLVFNKK